MRYIEGTLPVLELTRRNLATLLEKLDDPLSQKTLICGDGGTIAVRAVEDSVHYADREAGHVTSPSRNALYELQRRLQQATERLIDLRKEQPQDRARLSAKAQGVQLALSYVEEYLR